MSEVKDKAYFQERMRQARAGKDLNDSRLSGLNNSRQQIMSSPMDKKETLGKMHVQSLGSI